MATVVGLDVGTHAVRAVELTLGRDRPALTGFGQVALPVGAVQHGEIVDPGLVSASLRRLWSEAGFRTRRVIVGVGNQRVIVRHVELPRMSEGDLRSAIRFEAESLIPIPIDEAVLDFQILDESGTTTENQMPVLLVAAQREMVSTLLTAVEGAGLSATLVDVAAFALMRALPDNALGLDELGPARGIVSIGAGVTNVVVHEQGVPRFVRTLTIGGDDVTNAIAEELGVDVDMAEDLKRRADAASSDELVAHAGRIVADRLAPLLEEVRDSVDFYLAQPGASPVGRVTLTGGSSLLPGVYDRLGSLLGTPITAGHPLTSLALGRTGIPEEVLRAQEAVITTPVGLALAGRKPEVGTRRLSLVPPEVSEVAARRREQLLAGSAVVGIAAVLAALWVARGSEVSRERRKARAAEAEAAQLQQQVNGLQQFATDDAQLKQRQQLATSLLADDVAWTRLLSEVATVIPDDVWLTGFQGRKGASATPSAAGSVGSVTFSAMGFDQTSAARWLLRMADAPSFSGVWLPSSTRSSGANGLSLDTFTSTADLTPAARSHRADDLRASTS